MQVRTLNEITSILTDCGWARKQSLRVVQCHGTFDLLHPGHIRYLQKAKALGTMLIVTVTADRWVNKGPGRPLVPEQLRAEALAALACVDYVVINDASTAAPAIRMIRPDVYCKGEEYRNPLDDPTGGIAREIEAADAVGARVEFISDPVRFSSSEMARKLTRSVVGVERSDGEDSSFFTQLGAALSAAVADTHVGALGVSGGIAEAVALVREVHATDGKLMFIGNGGSAATSAHMAEDWLKTAGVLALAFNDGALLTCLGNDVGFEGVFAVPVGRFAKPGDVLFALSASGASENVLRAVQLALKRHCVVVTLSGFKPDNALRGLGALRFWVPSLSYGVVETAHMAICHAVLDAYVDTLGEAA